ncbi:MAG: FtsW/RodA/SpoVE family cell cycle protein, partial [Oscillospiraceae bacterium]|nr:FtsW/RodA/SpoVE family cell cycle protein [Oscillospiraceae bacterium]
EKARRRAAARNKADAGLVPKNAEEQFETAADKLLREDAAAQPARQRAPRFYGVDVPFLVISMILLGVGLIMMYSASYAWAIYDEGDPNYYINRQIIFALLGLAAMTAIVFFDYRIMKKLLPFYLVVVLAMLILVSRSGLTGGGAKRWISAGAFTLQPSEFAKLGVVWFLAWIYDKAGVRVRKFVWGIVPLAGVLLVTDAFLIMQKHISALVLVTLTGAAVAFYAGVNWKWLTGIGLAGAAGVSLMVAYLPNFGYIRARLAVFRDPFSDALDVGYQTVQSIYAVASGGLFGRGIGGSVQKQLFLPESQNDYVFSICCEELGFVGTLLLIALFAAFVAAGFRIAFRVKDVFGKLLVAGIMTLLAMQILLNIMVVINAFPVTGVSLPFFSYGGTSLVLLMIEVGIVLCVSRQSEKTF